MQITYVPDRNRASGQPVQPADPFTGIPARVDISEWLIHTGASFRVDQAFNVPGNGTVGMMVITPPAPVKVHLNFHIVALNETDFQVFEDTKVSVAGTQTFPYNANRIIGGTSQSRLFASPIIASNGNLIGEWHSGSGKIAGGDWASEEQVVLKQNGTYYATGTNIPNQSGWISFHLNFYEMS